MNKNILVSGSLLRNTYRINKHLASGGFGNTYVATNLDFDEIVAIKEFFMKDSMERDETTSEVSVSNADMAATVEEQREKFRKEARRLRKLHNGHIVRVHDLFDENGTTYYVMDYVDGENLSERMKRTGKPLTEKEVMDLLPQILDALKSVHDAGLWHLDMKPSNIMVDSRGQVKLIDFGASKQLNAQTGGAAATSNIARTDHYAPIEQLDGNYSKLGPWSDIYSLGATLFSLLTKQTPPTPSQIIDDETADKSIALPMTQGISKNMRNLILWMMNTNRTKRPQSIEEIEKYIKHNSVGASANNDSADRRNGKVSNHSSEETIIDTRQEEKTKAKHNNVNLQDEYNKFYGVSGTEEKNVKTEQILEDTDEGETDHTVVVVLFAIAIIIVGLLCIAKCTNDDNGTSKTTAGQLQSSNKYTGFASKNIYTSVGKGRYEGNLENGIENGRGMITYTNGQKFIGYFKNGVPHGHGTFYDANGKVLYDGEYKNGIRVSDTDYKTNGEVESTKTSNQGEVATNNVHSPQDKPTKAAETTKGADADNRIYDVTDEMPSYPGGISALMNYLSSNIVYPRESEENGIQGRVLCSFVVEKNGSISNVRIERSVDKLLDAEAIRVIKKMPRWIPGKMRGSNIRVKFTLPITFRLQ